jgi:hypothetical protein
MNQRMAFAALAAATLLAIGCGAGYPGAVETDDPNVLLEYLGWNGGGYKLRRITDTTNGIVCYSLDGRLSCVRVQP